LAEKRRVQQEEYQKNQATKNKNKKGSNEKKSGPGAEVAVDVAQETADLEAATAALEDNADEDEREEVRRLLQEENIRMLEPEETENLTVLDGLTGKPVPTDILQFAVPVCAPYGALQKYKYKVKLIPGSLKKGKAVKSVVNYFLTMSEGQFSSESDTRTVNGLSGQELVEAEAALEARERELIKMVKEEEAINVMIGKTKISAPGVESTKKKAGGQGKGRK
jgi:hypothetical protein